MAKPGPTLSPTKPVAASPTVRLQALCVGDYVRRVLRQHQWATVVAVFERSLYLAFGTDRFVCIGAHTIGAGPLNVLLRDADWAHACNVTHGQSVEIACDALYFGNERVIALDCAQLWRPHGRNACIATFDLGSRLAELVRLESRHAPMQGLCALAFAGARQENPDVILQTARPAWAALAYWLEESLGRQGRLPPPTQLSTLIGLGPGLTPSGDDVLAGVMIALSRLGYENVSACLWHWLAPQLRGRTGDLSAAHLAAASQGQGHSALHAVLDSVSGATMLRERAIVDLGQVGHCSGWDALAGVTLVLRTFLAAQRGTIAAASSAA